MPFHGVNASFATRLLCVGAIFLAACGSAIGNETEAAFATFSAQQMQFYQKNIQPILSDNCFGCHSHQAEKIKAGLVLDSREGALTGGDSGPAIAPGDPEKSLLISAVRHASDDLKMPPKKKLSDSQIALLTEWIKMGAPYSQGSVALPRSPGGRRVTAQDRNWWSYQPLRKVVVPEIAEASWCRNPIDNFVRGKLDAQGLAPAPEADKATLIRRVYFDVIGLPPTAEDVACFVNDSAPNAYEKIVDSLLDSPLYGEKWARHWLDLVRYAESDGFKLDAFRAEAWRYRDYVIRSFNQDKPYSRFLMEQIAADELWPDDPDALI